ncbi:MAG: InlB B-repeat-containing protein, partial [Christensenellales bacterium]
FTPISNYTFNFVPNEDGKYYFYEINHSNNIYEFQLTGEDNHKVVLYAYWEAVKYTISIIDTVDNNSKQSFSVPYGTDVNLANYITDHIGYKFTHLSKDKSGTSIVYSPETTMIIPGASIVANYTFYAIYEIRNIQLNYKIVRADNSELEYHPTSAYSQGLVKYGSTVILPTPTWNEYGDSNFKFGYWYYIENEQEKIIYSNTPLKYDGDVLTLYAKYEEQVFNMEFRFINPLDGNDIVEVKTFVDGDTEEKFVVKKGETISTAYYNYVLQTVNDLISDRDIKEYTLKGLYNYYNGKETQFLQGVAITSTNFPVLDANNTILFITIFVPNSVEIIYKSSEDADAEIKSGYHLGLDYSSTSDIILENVTFDSLGAGQSVKRWYILNSSNEKKYFNQGDYLIRINGEFTSIADMSDYIVWTLNESGKYVGTISIYAETQQVFTIEYYRYKDGAVSRLDDYTASHTYDSLSNTISLQSGDIAKYGDMIFNGWVVYNADGIVTSIGDNGIITGSITLDPTIFTDFVVRLYADLSYSVVYNTLALNGSVFDIEVLNTQTFPLISGSDYRLASNYVNAHYIDSVVDIGVVPTGYEYYGYKINDRIYTVSQIEEGFSIDISDEKIEILCYLSKTISISYQVSGDQKFSDGTTETKTYTYVLGYDNSVIAERNGSVDTPITVIKIKNITATKAGHYFAGWAIVRDGEVYAERYSPNTEIYLIIDTTFIAIFEEPQVGTINAVIKYVDENGNELYKDTVIGANGTTYTLISGVDSRINYNNPIKGITGWSYEGTAVNSNEFNIPLLIDNGQEFTFVAIFKDKYTIRFTTYSTDTVDNLVIFEGVETRLSTLPTLDNGKKFLHWSYDVNNDASNPYLINIDYDDAIMFKTAENGGVKYTSSESVMGYTLHIIPVVSGKYTYDFYAVGEDIILTLVVDDVDQDVSYELKNVQFGASYSARELVSKAGFGVFETSNRGIVAWTTDSTHRDMTYYNTNELKQQLADNISNITGDTTLYAVWQNKYTLSYAEENAVFGYKDEEGNKVTHSDEYFFAGDTIPFNAEVIKSIYYKGYNTVYYDDGRYIIYAGEGNDYYQVSGFTVAIEGGSSQDYIFADGQTSFEAPGANITITPLAKTIVYQVKFDENSSNEEKTLYTEYLSDLSELNLSNYSAKRTNFEFLGWNTDRDAENALSSLTKPYSNITLYAVWASTLSANFAINSEVIFSVPLNRNSQINSSKLNEYLSMNGKADNGYFNCIKLNENARTYNYNNINYYLNSFGYNGKVYDTVDKLCALTLDKSIIVNLVLEEIYTIKYTELDNANNNVEIESLDSDYVVKNSSG